jgi:hypothetical protein
MISKKEPSGMFQDDEVGTVVQYNRPRVSGGLGDGRLLRLRSFSVARQIDLERDTRATRMLWKP